MEIRVHGNRISVSDQLKELAAEKMERATKVFDDAQFIDVEFSEERNPRITGERVRVEITSTAAGHTVRVEAAAEDERTALDRASQVFERNLRKLKERLITRHRRGEKRLNEPPSDVEEDISDDRALRIERVKQFAVKPMMPEEAALQMETLGHSFYLFLNAETDRYGVLYRRKGGTLGLIEPQ